MKKLPIIFLFMTIAVMTACNSSSHRTEIEQRRAALHRHQDSSLQAAQLDLAKTDSLLLEVKADYNAMKTTVDQHKAELKATDEELTTLTRLRMKRDSLQVRWDALGMTIKYIRKKMSERTD